jgi:hypothetical protein
LTADQILDLTRDSIDRLAAGTVDSYFLDRRFEATELGDETIRSLDG